ncbi:MAG TPA: type IV toxin-antitoxin system AbiEi family antitoxin [Gallionellaceae bacterium]
MIEQEQTILRLALAALQKATGVTAQITALEPKAANGWEADAQVRIEANGLQYDYLAEVKRIDRFALLADMKTRALQNAGNLLLVAPRITPETADKCRAIDLQFIDAAGNAYLRQPGLLVWVKGERLKENDDLLVAKDEAKGKGTATNLRMIFVLLCKPELLNAPYRVIKDAAGIALGAVGWVFFDLDQRRYTLGGKKKGDRLLVEREKLAQEWITNFPLKLRPKLNARRFTAPTQDWWKKVDVTRYNAQWGGEVAAEKLTGHLRAETVTIYFQNGEAKKHLTKLVADHKLRADPKGNIEILDAFWDFQDEQPMPETVPPLLVYADLAATLDPRNLETAKLIYDEHIANNPAKG